MSTSRVHAVTVSVPEAERIMHHPETKRICYTYGIDLKTEPSSNKGPNGEPWVSVMVEADTDKQAGIGKGFVLGMLVFVLNAVEPAKR